MKFSLRIKLNNGHYSSASEVVKAALHLIGKEQYTKGLVGALKLGEKSGFIQDFNKELFTNYLHKKYLNAEH